MSKRALGALTLAWPWPAIEHGPLPAILVAPAVVTGVVDAVAKAGTRRTSCTVAASTSLHR